MMWRLVLFFIVLFSRSVFGQVSYSIPEEMPKGSVVGNIARDLGLDLKRLKSGKARIYTEDSAEYVMLDVGRGTLLLKEKIDRESLCAKNTPCALLLQMILENPMELYTVNVEITDINDNAPSFQKKEMRFEISEAAATGARFVLGRGVDADVGTNGLQSYSLKPTDKFALELHNEADGGKKVELVLQKALDREKEDTLNLLLTAIDGGDPQLSGTVQIHIRVLDVNDNAPVFTQKIYKTTITENSTNGYKLATVNASDADEGSNGHIKYYVSDTEESHLDNIFHLDQLTGNLLLKGQIDYEKASRYQLNIQARDEGGLSDSCTIIIDVIDINDNAPSINILSMSTSISEESASGTVVGMIKVNDLDSGINGKVHCAIGANIPFIITSTSHNLFSMRTEQELDREKAERYNITVTCSDDGIPALSSVAFLSLLISDVNDNAPVFERNHYEAYVIENNTPGLSIFTVKASDADSNHKLYR